VSDLVCQVLLLCNKKERRRFRRLDDGGELMRAESELGSNYRDDV
jgi:hypothetical protein